MQPSYRSPLIPSPLSAQSVSAIPTLHHWTAHSASAVPLFSAVGVQ